LNKGGVKVEDYVYVLDYLPKGRGDLPPHKRHPTVYGVGENQFTLLELIPKNNVSIAIGERIYVGKDPKKRNKINKIKGRVNYEDMTATAHGEMTYVLLDVVRNKMDHFIKFYNEAPAISTRFHVLELLPGLGKKMMHDILDERRKQPFSSFEDMTNRIDFLRAPDKLIAKRIELELTDPNQKYRLFTRPPISKGQYSY
jgi:putative nucleotide binding protein